MKNNALTARAAVSAALWVRRIVTHSALYSLTRPRPTRYHSRLYRGLMEVAPFERTHAFSLLTKFFGKRAQAPAQPPTSGILSALRTPFQTAGISFFLLGICALFFRLSGGFGLPFLLSAKGIIPLFLSAFILFLTENFLQSGVLSGSLAATLLGHAYSIDASPAKPVLLPVRRANRGAWLYGICVSMAAIAAACLSGRPIIGLFAGAALALSPIAAAHRFAALCTFLVAYPFLPDMVSIAGAMGFMLLAVADRLEGRRFTLQPNALLVPLFVVMLVCIVQTLTSLDMRGSLRDLVMNGSGFFLCLLIYRYADSRQKLHAIFVSIAIGAMLAALYGLVQYRFGGMVRREWIDATLKGVITRRAFSVFDNPNVYAEFLVLTIPISVGLAFGVKARWKRIIWALCAAFQSGIMLLTFSRGGMLALGVSAAVFLWFILRPLLVLSIPLGLLAFQFLPPAFQNRILSIANFKDSSTAYRFKMWGIVKEVIQDHPMVGVGLGHKPFKQAFEQVIRSMPIFHAHNTYLQTMAEGGLVGISVFFATIASAALLLLRGPLKSKDRYIRVFGAAFFAAGAGILVHGFFEHIVYMNRIILTLWICLGSAGALANLERLVRNQ